MPTTENLGLIRRIAALEKEVERLHAVEGPLSHTGFAAFMSANQQNIATGVATTVEFDLTRFNHGDGFDTATYDFTVPVTGVYLFILNLRLDDVDSAATLITTRIVTTPRNYTQMFPPIGLDQDVDGLGMSVSCIVNLVATQRAFATVEVTGGVAQMDITAGAVSKFAGWLIG